MSIRPGKARKPSHALPGKPPRPLTLAAAVALLVVLAGCPSDRPAFTLLDELERSTSGGPRVVAEIDPKQTTVTALQVEWGRRPSLQNTQHILYTEVPPAGFTFTPGGLPRTEPFRVEYRFPPPNQWGGNALQPGEIVDWQIRVTHTSDKPGEYYFWSQRRSFEVTGAAPPPPPPPPGGVDDDPCDPSVCENETRRVSIFTGNGSIADQAGSHEPSISPACRVVAFTTPVAFESNDTNGGDDVYIHDLVEDETRRVSIFTGGGSIADQAGSHEPSISGDGKVIAFTTPVAFDPDDTNGGDDVYVHDREENETIRVSVFTGNGSIADQSGSREPAVSADGRVVAFTTPVAFESNDNNGGDDVYVHDRDENRTFRVSIRTGSGSGADEPGAHSPSISRDGQVVAFVTSAALVNDDTNGAEDVYVHDAGTNQTTRVSIFTGGGSIANEGGSRQPSVSADGRFVAFTTPVAFESNDTNGADDVYVHDREAGETRRVSIFTGGGSIANPGPSTAPSISADGRSVAFTTAVALDPDDTNGADDVYIHDRQASETRRVSVFTGGGSIANPGPSTAPSISGDGQAIAFESPVALESSDTNGGPDVYVHCGD
ncbi:MAG: hypothetical protein QUU85_02750 [Candidatus Eisenbacteria bacterium]|nr:hypothetical protein [Candidatus Eisenbacteria bacterium]